MGPEERSHHAREMQTEAISADALEQMIETARADSAGRSGYVFSSFSTSGVSSVRTFRACTDLAPVRTKLEPSFKTRSCTTFFGFERASGEHRSKLAPLKCR
ncbi:hypothetical protein INT47_003000 [Mucor saturninus]|uniref:Uncharacterized protein n=1 Tax=Mucor saturninus TaxID=64648 RepID=A0A8H7QSJ8_9FUNG|nr:hypothetical protein INT47_003000 [Mucor saturninus]